MTKDTIYFDSNIYDNDKGVLEFIGNRGRRIMELASLNIPTSPGSCCPARR
ncbi:MAG: hypothetical protein HC888_10385 [Candidatus Competibacteraceae bacterium]|nr:hypothetical protein [Candidatus Competibacteraceae bacterium]